MWTIFCAKAWRSALHSPGARAAARQLLVNLIDARAVLSDHQRSPQLARCNRAIMHAYIDEPKAARQAVHITRECPVLAARSTA